MITLYTSPLSTPALSIMFGANALGIEHTVKTIDLAGAEHRRPDFLAVNPAGKVPAMTDEDFALFESGAILRYLGRKVKSPLYPSQLRARAIGDQWLDYVAHHVRTPFGRIQFNRMFAERFGEKPDEASIAFGFKILKSSLPLIEGQIAKHGYVMGDFLALADIALLATLDPSEVCGVDLSAYPALTDWRVKLKAEKFYTDVHSHYGAEIGL